MSLRLGLVGDSIAWGQGASRDEDRLAARLSGALAAAGVEAVARVVAEPGARSSDLERQVDRLLPWRPDVAVIVVGANDLTHRVPAAAAANALGTAVRRLHEAGVEVVVAPAPDLSAVPHVPPDLRPVVRLASDQLRGRQEAAVRAAGGTVADADGQTARRFHDDPALFAGDRFHPSSAGYAVIAEGLRDEVVAAARRAISRSRGR